MLTPGELSVGMFITVLENKPYQSENIVGNEMLGETSVKTISRQDNSYKGDILEVVAINLPYIVVKWYWADNENKAKTIDTRRSTFMELSDEFVLALYPNLEIKKKTVE